MKRLALAISIALTATRALPQSHEGMDHDMPGMDTGTWSGMLHGYVNAIYDDQGGPRGARKGFGESMFMVMGAGPVPGGSLDLRAMLSLDPLMGRSGYPLLFQTGETADGRTHLVDRQHPHDAFMELSARYARPLGERTSVFLYAGLPGDPALGPGAFMHRFSGTRIPEAPITHHWLDSTHITMGVVTVGASAGPWKVEGSRFRGREPDSNRWNIETGRLDSSSARLSFNPSSEWSMQVSYGNLHAPEQLEPEVNVKRTTASVARFVEMDGMRWGTTLAWGRNRKADAEGVRALDGWLLESTLEISSRHTMFARIERVANDELLDHDDPRAGQVFQVGKLSLGYIHDFARTGPLKWGVGALASAYDVPAALRADYGRRPTSYMAFLQARF